MAKNASDKLIEYCVDLFNKELPDRSVELIVNNSKIKTDLPLMYKGNSKLIIKTILLLRALDSLK